MSGISNDRLLCIAVVCVCFNFCSGGTAVNFNAQPAVIVESLTKSVHMHCGVNDLSKRAWSTNASEDIDHVTQITVSNNQGAIIAKVGEDKEVMVDHNKGGLTASGTVTGNAHLELTFAAPSEMDMGVYKCNIIAISTNNRHMFLARTFNVKSRPATVPDVISDLKNLKQCLSRKSGFMAVMSSSKTVPGSVTAVFDKVIYTSGGGYDPSTGVFTCDEPGIYSFSVIALSPVRNHVEMNIMLNSDRITSAYSQDDSHFNTAATSALVHLNKNDTVRVKSVWGGSNYFYSTYLPQANVFLGQLEHSDCVH